MSGSRGESATAFASGGQAAIAALVTRESSSIVALVGAGLLAIGCFLPLVDVPKLGAVTLMEADWAWAGIAMLVLAAAGGVLVLLGQTRHAIWPGLAALGLLVYAFVSASTEIERARLRLRGGLGDDPLARLGDLAATNSRFDYGWAVLVFGALGLIAAGVLAWRRRPLER